MFGATFASTWNAWFKMERSHVYHAAASTPLSVEDVALGEIMWATTRATIYGSAFLIIATLFGVFKSWWGLSRPVDRAGGLVFAITGLIYTYWIKHVDYLAYYWTLFITPMFMFAGVFFPLERLPQWVRTIASFMPLHHGANLMRALMTQGDPSAALEAALWLLAVSVVLLPVRSSSSSAVRRKLAVTPFGHRGFVASATPPRNIWLRRRGPRLLHRLDRLAHRATG